MFMNITLIHESMQYDFESTLNQSRCNIDFDSMNIHDSKSNIHESMSTLNHEYSSTLNHDDVHEYYIDS